MEIIKCNKTKVGVLIFAILFLFSACAFGQFYRYNCFKDKRIVTISSFPYMEFATSNDDKDCRVGILVDSLSDTQRSYRIFVFFNNEVVGEDCGLIFGLDNGYVISLSQIWYNEDTKYAEYDLTDRDVFILTNNPLIYFAFNAKNRTFTNIDENKDPYFQDFLKVMTQ